MSHASLWPLDCCFPFLLLFGSWQSAVSNSLSSNNIPLLTARSSPGDLEIGGELSGLPKGTVRYVRYEDLLKLPQETYTVSDDTNLQGARRRISGVALNHAGRALWSSIAHSRPDRRHLLRQIPLQLPQRLSGSASSDSGAQDQRKAARPMAALRRRRAAWTLFGLASYFQAILQSAFA